MIENYTIQFSRNKEEAKRVYFNRDFKKSIRIQIIRIILFLPGFLISAFFFSVALQVVLELKDHDYILYMLTLLFTIIFISPFIKPIFKVFQITRNHINEMYKHREIITAKCNFDDLGFSYKNDFFEYSTSWENIRNLKVNQTYLQFQSIMPNVLFILPKEKISEELLNHIRQKLANNS